MVVKKMPMGKRIYQFYESIRECPARKRGDESCGLTGLNGRPILVKKNKPQKAPSARAKFFALVGICFKAEITMIGTGNILDDLLIPTLPFPNPLQPVGGSIDLVFPQPDRSLQKCE